MHRYPACVIEIKNEECLRKHPPYMKKELYYVIKSMS